MFQNVSSADASVFSRHLCIPCFLNLILISIKKFHFPEIRHVTLLSKVLFMSFLKIVLNLDMVLMTVQIKNTTVNHLPNYLYPKVVKTKK